MTDETTPTYDRNSTGWDYPLGGRDHPIRADGDRQRCGVYTGPDGGKAWGDHRVTVEGSTCIQAECTVAHHPTILPGWAEPMPDYHERPGVRAIAAALWGWDGAGMLNGNRLGDTLAFVAAHVALDALRDAGYQVVGESRHGDPRASTD